jgi:hypothetical protein
MQHIKLQLLMKDDFDLEKLDAALQSVGFQMEQIHSLSGDAIFMISKEIKGPHPSPMTEEDLESLKNSLNAGNNGDSLGSILREESWPDIDATIKAEANRSAEARARINAAAARCPTCPGPGGGCVHE